MILRRIYREFLLLLKITVTPELVHYDAYAIELKVCSCPC